MMRARALVMLMTFTALAGCHHAHKDRTTGDGISVDAIDNSIANNTVANVDDLSG